MLIVAPGKGFRKIKKPEASDRSAVNAYFQTTNYILTQK